MQRFTPFLIVLCVVSFGSGHASAQLLPLGSLIVTITSPADGSTVGGTTPFAAQVSIVGGLIVQRVEFKVDGVVVATDSTAPYSIPWNTTTASNGTHRLTACARDLLGVVWESNTVTVTVFNDVTPPAVAIGAPSNGATVSGTVAVTANASDNVGVAGVQFRLDGANLGAEDRTPPYSVSWNTAGAANGAHTLTAVARDAAGNTGAAAAVTVTVLNDMQPPAVAMTSPAGGAVVEGTITVAASASDDVGVVGVRFQLDGGNLGAEDTSAPYSASWDTATAANGSHALRAIARDASGKSTTSAAVTITVRNDTTPPTVAITAPADGAQVGGTVAISAEASDDIAVASVRVLVDGVQQGATLLTPPYSVGWDTTASSDGPHALTAVAEDAKGNSTTSPPVTVTVANTTETTARLQESASSIAYTGSWSMGNTAKAWSGGTAALATGGPTATGTPTRATLTFTGTAVSWIGFRGPQTGIARVLLDGAVVATVDTYSATDVLEAVLYTTSGLPHTSHTLGVEATGTKNASSSDIFIIVDAFDVTAVSGPDTTPPAITITSPSSGSTVAGTVPISATATDDRGVTRVEFLVDGILVGEDAAPPFSGVWDSTTAADGAHSLTAVAHDAAGHRTTSAGVSVTVSNAAPPPAATSTRFENTDLAIGYVPGSPASGPPGWWHGSRSRAWSGVTSSFNRSQGARATFTFTGTSVSWIGFRAPWAGIARVHVDGAFVQQIDLYSPTEHPQDVVFSQSGLAPGSHTIAVEVTDLRNPAAEDNAVVVDAFDVAPPAAPTLEGARTEETSARVAYDSGWTQGDVSTAWSGGSAATSTAAGARATFSFSGTSVSWVGLRSPHTGIARIYLDGAFQAEVDTYAAKPIQAVIYSATHLAPGGHELTVEVTGRRNAAAGGHLIVVDAFDVRSRFEEPHASVAYSGAWSAQNFDKLWSGTTANTGSGGAVISSTAGSRAAFTFSGTAVTWIGYRGPQAGIARVYVDGALAGEVDTYAPAEEIQAALFTASSLAPDVPHLLEIEVAGTRNPGSLGSLVAVDAFDVTPPATVPPVRRFQQADAVYPNGGWQQSTPSNLYSGQTVALATTAGARAEFTFTGTGIRWIGQRRRDAGIARVYLDGVLVADVDTFAAVQDDYQVPVFTRTGLAPGAHTLTIEVTGLTNPQAGSTQVIIDAFDVIQ